MSIKNLRDNSFYLAIFISILMYYYLYFIPFNQGLNSSVGLFVIAKIIVTLLIFVSFKASDIKPDYKMIIPGLVLVLFFGIAMIRKSNSDTLFLNYLNFALLIPLFKTQSIREKAQKSFNIISYVLVLQVVIDILLVDIFKIYLWDEKIFIGGFGNPSTFAFFCLFSFLWIISRERYKYLDFILGTVLLYGIVRSSALFIYLLVFINLALLFILDLEKKIKNLTWICISSIVLAIGRGDYLIYKIYSIFHWLGWTSKPFLSDSVTVRVKNYKTIMNQGIDFIGFKYLGVDSQYITILISFGIVGAIILLYPVLKNLIILIKNRKIDDLFLFIMFLNFILIFFNNRILDYYPVSYLYFIILVLNDRKLKIT